MLWLIIHRDYDGEKYFIRSIFARLYDDSYTKEVIEKELDKDHPEW